MQSDRANAGHLSRYQQIADALSQHGMGYMVSVLGLELCRALDPALH